VEAEASATLSRITCGRAPCCCVCVNSQEKSLAAGTQVVAGALAVACGVAWLGRSVRRPPHFEIVVRGG
jgi:hypothetical protein